MSFQDQGEKLAMLKLAYTDFFAELADQVDARPDEDKEVVLKQIWEGFNAYYLKHQMDYPHTASDFVSDALSKITAWDENYLTEKAE